MDNQELVIVLIFGLAFGVICRSMAGKRGRDKGWGFALGLLFGVVSMLGYAIIGDTEEVKLAKAKKLCEKYN